MLPICNYNDWLRAKYGTVVPGSPQEQAQQNCDILDHDWKVWTMDSTRTIFWRCANCGKEMTTE